MSTKHKIANLVNNTCDESGTTCRDWLQATATAVIENCHWRNRFWPKVNEPNLTRGRGSPQFAYVLLPPTLSQITTRSWNSKQRREGERSRADDTTLDLASEWWASNLGNWPNNGMYGNVGLRFRPTSSFWQQSIRSLDGIDSSWFRYHKRVLITGRLWFQ